MFDPYVQHGPQSVQHLCGSGIFFKLLQGNEHNHSLILGLIPTSTHPITEPLFVYITRTTGLFHIKFNSIFKILSDKNIRQIIQIMK
jgi:hypothetical protein